MSEIRKDPASSTFVIIAPERAGRPFSSKEEVVEHSDSSKCPFCEGDHEPGIPYDHEIEGKVFRVLVVKNKFPALALDNKGILSDGAPPVYHSFPAIGQHEVLVEGDIHERNLAYAPQKEIECILHTYRERYLYWDKDDRIKYVLIFRNYGKDAGASLTHPHSQLMALPMVPPRVFDEIETARAYYALNESRCLYCDLAGAEAQYRERVFHENGSMIAFAPFAPRSPYELMIMPKTHRGSFKEISDEEARDLAEMLSLIAKAYSSLLKDPPFNIVIHTSPTGTQGLDHYHWHVEIFPRTTKPAGFEWGAGMYINSVTPEKSILELLMHKRPQERS